MIRFALRKIFLFVVSLFAIATITFFLMHAIPGDPFTEEKAIPEEIMHALKEHYGLNDPLMTQYGHYLKNLLHGDLGPSLKYSGRSVGEMIMEGFPISALLGLEAILFALAFGIILGSISAIKNQKWEDRITSLFSVIGISVPSFILATFLQYIFAMQLNLLPVARWGTFAHTILPALSLAAFPTAMIAKLTRSSMLEVIEQDYIITARAKGLSLFQCTLKHKLRNALLPVLTYLGPLTTAILTGAFAVEKIFGIPGLGQWFVLSISNRDYTMIMGFALFYSTLLMVTVLIVDLLYSVLDPRILSAKKR